jgi:hypothetical protein
MVALTALLNPPLAMVKGPRNCAAPHACSNAFCGFQIPSRYCTFVQYLSASHVSIADVRFGCAVARKRSTVCIP